jgi:hypothetical protein
MDRHLVQWRKRADEYERAVVARGTRLDEYERLVARLKQEIRRLREHTSTYVDFAAPNMSADSSGA